MSVEIATKTSATAVRELAWSTVKATRGQWIALGKELQKLKAETLADKRPRSDWYKLFGEDSKRRQLPDVSKDAGWPFGSDTADKLIRVAETFGSVENSVLERLPDSWGTLHVLTNVPSDKYKAALESGDIRPGMTRAQANHLKPADVAPEVVQERDKNVAKAFLRKLKSKETRLAVAVEVLRETGCTLEQIKIAWQQSAPQPKALAA